MFWYIIICFIILYSYILVSVGKLSGNNAENLLLKITCGILLFFMGLRAINVGVDTKYYGFVFSQFSEISWSKIFTAVTYATEERTWAFEFEPGDLLINKVLSCLGNSPQIITFFNSAIIIILLYFLIKSESKDQMLSIWLYVTLGFFQTEMNVTRNAIAIFLVYNAFYYIQKKNLLKYALYIIGATMIHKSAVVFFPLYWLVPRITLDVKKMLVFITSGIFLGLNFQVIGPVIRAIVPFGLDKYFSSSNDKMETLIVGMLYAGIVCGIFFLTNKEECSNSVKNNQIGSWMFTLNLCFFGLNIGLGSAARMAAVFGPYIIIYIPQLLDSISLPKNKKTVTWIVILICGIQYILRMFINNIGGTMPYQFFWN